VLTLGINCDQAELARLRGLDESTKGLELAPSNLYTRPLISQGNLERLLQAESSTRRDHASLPQTTEPGPTVTRLQRLQAVMRRRLEERSRQYTRDTAPTQTPEPLEINGAPSTQGDQAMDTLGTMSLGPRARRLPGPAVVQ
jgi:hypothetical protein